MYSSIEYGWLALFLTYAISFPILFFYDFVKSYLKRKQNDIKQNQAQEQRQKRSLQLQFKADQEYRRRKRDRTKLKFKNDKQRNTTNLLLLAIKEAYKSGYHGSFDLAEEEARRICRRIL